MPDEGNNRLIVVDAQGRTLWTFPQPGHLPPGVSFKSPTTPFFTPNGKQIIATEEASAPVRPVRPKVRTWVPLPRPGDRSPGFMAEPGRCRALVHCRQLQSIHCQEAPAYTGRWYSPRGDKWFSVWSCPEHLEGLTGVRQFGRCSRI